MREGRLRCRDECVGHARGRAQVAAVQEMVILVDISGGAVREETPGRPSHPGRRRRRARARQSYAQPGSDVLGHEDAER